MAEIYKHTQAENRESISKAFAIIEAALVTFNREVPGNKISEAVAQAATAVRNDKANLKISFEVRYE